MKNFILFIVFLYSLPIGAIESNSLKPFTSDGCSVAPDSDYLIGKGSWLNCCVQHDTKYWLGGTLKEKNKADSEFKQCLEKAGMNSLELEVYYQAVEYGGTPYIPSNWRWGYGWKYNRGYRPLSSKELNEARRYFSLFKLPQQLVLPNFLSFIENLFEVKIFNNYCEIYVAKSVNQFIKSESRNDILITKVESKNKNPTYTAYSKKCPGGYFLVEFERELFHNSNFCLIENFLKIEEQVKEIKAYGECKKFIR